MFYTWSGLVWQKTKIIPIFFGTLPLLTDDRTYSLTQPLRCLDSTYTCPDILWLHSASCSCFETLEVWPCRKRRRAERSSAVKWMGRSRSRQAATYRKCCAGYHHRTIALAPHASFLQQLDWSQQNYHLHVCSSRHTLYSTWQKRLSLSRKHLHQSIDSWLWQW